MSNEGVFQISLVGVHNDPVRDDDVAVKFLKNGGKDVVLDEGHLRFPPSHAFRLPAFPQASNLLCQVTASRYYFRQSGFFTLFDGETVRRDLTLLRDGRKWKARFTRWNDLPGHFAPLQAVLQNSAGIQIKATKKVIPSFTGPDYEVDDDKNILAKASLLNLFAKLSGMDAPGTGGSWFSHVERILVIDRERCIALVRPAMAKAVRAIKDKIAEHKIYKHTPAGNHHKNMPAQFKVPKSKMYSIKSDEDNGNIQLTIGPGTDPASGKEVFLLDSDIDENGRLLPHLVDVLFRHKIKGGTHPFDIHEYLALTQPGVPIGYELV